MWWAKAGDWSAKAVDQYLGQEAAHKANRTNIRLAKENREWLTEMSNTEVQRHVKDLVAAGLNPMLGYTGQASTPHAAPARVEPTYESGKESANPRIMESMMMNAQVKNLEASARLTNANAALEESKIPHSAKSAQTNADILQETLVKLGQDIEMNDLTIKHQRLTNEQLEKMQPLLLKAQDLVNKGLQEGISRKELESNVADFLNIPFAVGGDAIRYLNELGSNIGTKAADAEEWFRSLPRRYQEWRENNGRRQRRSMVQ